MEQLRIAAQIGTDKGLTTNSVNINSLQSFAKKLGQKRTRKQEKRFRNPHRNSGLGHEGTLAVRLRSGAGVLQQHPRAGTLLRAGCWPLLRTAGLPDKRNHLYRCSHHQLSQEDQKPRKSYDSHRLPGEPGGGTPLHSQLFIDRK